MTLHSSPDILDKISQYLVKHKKTLAFAESCTGGLLSAEIVSKPGASKYFLGSVISYTALVKVGTLGVPLEELEASGEVSQRVAQLMAEGVREKLGSDWAVSVTGFAGPDPSSTQVGTVFFAVVGPNFVYNEEVLFKLKQRKEIQRASVNKALELLLSSFQSQKGE